ncbi:MAG TPA: PAS domain S-box protein [Desulfobacteraceae bacterium]|nr:PAS domain S-box protein [Desulfobacteraceae bacterium]
MLGSSNITETKKMENDVHEIFRLAAKYFYRKYKKNIGSQAQIAKKLGITPSYVSAIMSGSKTASLELQNQIAAVLYGPYEEFLMIGRRIKNNLDPELKEKFDTDDGVEKLIARLTHYVMDHQRIERELVETKNFYEDIVQNLQSGVLVMDKDDRIYFANRFINVIMGVTPEKLLGVNVLIVHDQFPTMEYGEFLKTYVKTKKSMKPFFYENIRVVTPVGQEAYLDGWLIPHIKNGAYNGMTCTIRDATRSHDLSKLLKLSLDHIPYAISITKQFEAKNYGGTYFTNKKMRQLFDQENTEQAGMTIEEFLAKCEQSIVNKDEWRLFLLDCYTADQRDSLEIQHVNGRQYRWICENLLDRDGKSWGRITEVREMNESRSNKSREKTAASR